MTAREWIARAEPAAPPALAARVIAVLDAHPAWERLSAADALTRAGEALLQVVLGHQESDPARDVALELLAADACVTWAFEAAAAEPGTLPARAQEAMQRIAEVAR